MPKNHRRCISCRRVAHKSEFWRVVAVHPSQHVQLDVGMGRSVYLCPTAECLMAAQKKNRLGRALKIATGAEIYQRLAIRLRKEENGL
jgi:uncharacterized protein